MSNVKNTKKMKSFVKQFIALVEGDSAAALAQKTLRKADSALKTHTAVLEGDLITKEEAVTNAQEQLEKAKVNNGEELLNRDVYVSNLLRAYNEVVEAEEDLELHKAKLAFLTETKEGLSEEV